MRIAIIATSLLSLSLGATAAALPAALDDRNVHSWELIAQPLGLPVIVGGSYANSGNMWLSNGTEGETKTRITFEEKTNWFNETFIAAKILDHPGIDTDIYMAQSFAAKLLYFCVFKEITGKGGSWGFEKEEHSNNRVLSLNGDTKAVAVWEPTEGRHLLFFGSDVPPDRAAGGIDVVLVGVKH